MGRGKSLTFVGSQYPHSRKRKMSITLDYVTDAPVSAAVAVVVQKSARQSLTAHDWWAEPLSVSLSEANHLEGSTRIILGGYGDIDVPAEEEELMTCIDTRFILRKLAEWSSQHSISWRVSIMGNDLGVINNGVMSSGLQKLAPKSCANAKLSESDVNRVLKKHEARKY